MEKTIRFGLRERLISMVVVISMLITTIMSVLYYVRVSSLVKDNYRKTVAENLHTRADLFDSIMKNAYLTSVYGVTDDRLVQLVKADDTYEELIDVLREYCQGQDAIQSIYCYVNESDTLLKISLEDTQVGEGTFLNHVWISQVLDEQEENPFSPVFNRDSTSVIRRNFFTYAKRIYNKNGTEKGALFVNVDERQVYFECLQTAGNSSGTLSIVKDNYIVCTERVPQIGKKVVETEKIIMVQYPCEGSDYSFCSRSRSDVLEDNLRTTRNWILLVALLLNLLMAGPIYLAIRYLMYPMRKLEENMNLVKDGNLDVRATIYRDDEIGSLSENFNDMLEQLETLIDELVTQKMLKKEAELEALSYQITPHFMYNTLSSIRYAAILDGYEEIGDLLQAFIELLRLSASDRGAFITVQQEFKMVNNYILLQQFRYKESFDTHIEMEPGTELFYVPRLLIQPLVENAILHGLDHMEKGNRITVMVRRLGTKLEIRVSDNGSGMTREEIELLLSGGYHSKFSGIGINNIIERLNLYYGDKGNLNYYCPPQGGTTAVIILPVSDDAEEYVI